jgi:hypothetical protein
MGKPLPPEPDIRLATRLGWWAWSYLSWPWQVRKLKAAGFRRAGWMTWETGPELRAAITDEILTGLDDAGPPEPPAGPLFMGPLGTSEGWGNIGLTADRIEFDNERLRGGMSWAEWTDPKRDSAISLLLDGERPAGDRSNTRSYPKSMADRMPSRRTLHCAADVADTGLEGLPYADPEAYVTGWPSWMTGVGLTIERAWEPGRWELREAGTVIDSGRLEGL